MTEQVNRKISKDERSTNVKNSEKIITKNLESEGSSQVDSLIIADQNNNMQMWELKELAGNRLGFSYVNIERMAFTPAGSLLSFGTQVVKTQEGAIAALADSSGGTDAGAGGAIAVITDGNNAGSADLVPVRNAIATLAGQLERALAALRAHGLIA